MNERPISIENAMTVSEFLEKSDKATMDLIDQKLTEEYIDPEKMVELLGGGLEGTTRAERRRSFKRVKAIMEKEQKKRAIETRATVSANKRQILGRLTTPKSVSISNQRQQMLEGAEHNLKISLGVGEMKEPLFEVADGNSDSPMPVDLTLVDANEKLMRDTLGISEDADLQEAITIDLSEKHLPSK